MITIEPTGGLCNRMRAIDSAIALCKDIQRDLEIKWVRNKGLNARFSDLFQPITEIPVQVHEARTSAITRSKWYKKREMAKYDIVIDHDECKRLSKSDYDFTALGEYKRPFISGFLPFYENPERFSAFAPVARIETLIQEETRGFADRVVGVHVRRSDHQDAIRQSPLEAFIETMEDEIRQKESTRFYLASDDLGVKETMKARFGERLMTNTQEASRSDLQGIIDAVVELYALSRTDKLIGSFRSSFSRTAAHLGKIDEIVIRCD